MVLPATIGCWPLVRPEVVQSLRADYLRTLVAPVDGMWEGAVIAQAGWWEIHDEARRIGFFCLDDDHTLLRFHLQDDYRARAQAIFRWLVASRSIRQAV